MAAGDILLYSGHGALYERLIERATGGPYCHVEIDLGDGSSIGALSQGIVRRPLPAPTAVAPVGTPLAQRDPQRFALAVAWLAGQVGRRYSWLDIAGDALKALLPARLGSTTPFLVLPSAYDCSALAATFLVLAGEELPPALVTDLARVSPNDLARALLHP